jgi:hypothetical protein
MRGEYDNLHIIFAESLKISPVTCELQLSIVKAVSALEGHGIVLANVICGTHRYESNLQKGVDLT